MMSAIGAVFTRKKAYVAYLMAGDGGFEHSLQVMQHYAESGVDIIEVGVPFSDPLADGPIIQAAAMRALAGGFTLRDVLRLITTFKQTHATPIILFTYFNPILQAGRLQDFFLQARAAGVDGSLIVDLPLEEDTDYHSACMAAGIDPIYVIAPSTPAERIATLAQRGRGMLYYACRKGVTGMRDGLPEGFAKKIAAIKAISDLPVAVGFGIGSRDTALAVLKEADGFVVGSLLVEAASKYPERLLSIVAMLGKEG